MGLPLLVWHNFDTNTVASASDSATSYSASDVLTATEDSGHMFATAGFKYYTFDFGTVGASGQNKDVCCLAGYSTNRIWAWCEASADGSTWTPQDTNVVTNGTFVSDTAWTKGTGWTIGSGVATVSGAQTGASSLDQECLAFGVLYVVRYTISSYSAGELRIKCGTAQGTARSANGTYIETILGNGTTLKLEADADGAMSVDNVTVIAANYLPMLENAAYFQFTNAIAYRYWRVGLYSVGTDTLINHIALITALSWPYLESDWDKDRLDLDLEHRRSAAGYYAGTTVTAALRKLPVNFGAVTTSDYTTIATLADEVIRAGSGLFFIPDIDQDECYLGHFDESEFSAPYVNGMREVKPLTFVTRA